MNLKRQIERHIKMGDASYFEGQYDVALEQYRAALALNPQMAEIHWKIGSIYVHSDPPNYTQASVEFSSAIHIAPSWADAHLSLAEVFYTTENYASAIEEYRVAMRLAPTDARIPIALGNCHLIVKNYVEAILYLKQGIQLKPHYAEADARLLLAEALEKTGQIHEAREQWQIIINMSAAYPSYEEPIQTARNMLALHNIE